MGERIKPLSPVFVAIRKDLGVGRGVGRDRVSAPICHFLGCADDNYDTENIYLNGMFHRSSESNKIIFYFNPDNRLFGPARATLFLDNFLGVAEDVTVSASFRLNHFRGV